MGASLEEIMTCGRAQANIVVSQSGLAAANDMYERLGIPYVVGLPVGKKPTEELLRLLEQTCRDGKNRMAAPPRPGKQEMCIRDSPCVKYAGRKFTDRAERLNARQLNVLPEGELFHLLQYFLAPVEPYDDSIFKSFIFHNVSPSPETQAHQTRTRRLAKSVRFPQKRRRTPRLPCRFNSAARAEAREYARRGQ